MRNCISYRTHAAAETTIAPWGKLNTIAKWIERNKRSMRNTPDDPNSTSPPNDAEFDPTVNPDAWVLEGYTIVVPKKKDNGMPPARIGELATPTLNSWSDWGRDRTGIDIHHRPKNQDNVERNKHFVRHGIPNLPREYNHGFLTCRTYLVSDYGGEIDHPALLNRVSVQKTLSASAHF